ncbi:hypothetical protein [Rhodococcus jostii]|uniref:hypothetical protein n=1 Tax=Rhodococcus jostii TaxID=132919 RepID=UPI003644ECF2
MNASGPRTPSITARTAPRADPGLPRLLHVCGDGTRGCHGWITAHPDTACELGWSVRGYADPAQVLVLYRDGARYRLTDTGHLDHCTHDDCLDLTDPGYGNYIQCVDCGTQFNTDGGSL